MGQWLSRLYNKVAWEDFFFHNTYEKGILGCTLEDSWGGTQEFFFLSAPGDSFFLKTL